MRSSAEPSSQYKELIHISSYIQIGEKSSSTMSMESISQLVLEASALSHGSDSEKQRAYDIITRLLEINECVSPGLIAASKMILARIGNFPGVTLIEERYGTEHHSSFWMGLEAAVRKTENTVTLGEGEKIVLNDFQSDYIAEYQNAKSLSISGPTSAGKSFALSLLVAKTLEANPGSTIVYIVPTRALIRQVSRDLRKVLEKSSAGKTIITAVPYPVVASEGESVIYILTQERLHSLLYTPILKVTFDLIIVDEATEISARSRGVLLERSVQSALQISGGGKIIFSSALCGNPDFMNKLFELNDRAQSLIANLSPVSQNIFSVGEVSLKPKQVKILVKSGDIETDLGIFNLPFKFRDSGRLPAAALHFTRAGDSSIVYANRAIDAELYAAKMADVITEDFSTESDIAALCDFLNTTIHPSYALIKCLKRGVAFHYGSMPDIVREEVENLFSQRKVKFICCTSTLLQGVNLPAKNIFLHNPQRGTGKMISSHDFWNLIGRAGRLGKEFHGNVWCIAREKWNEDPVSGPKHVEIRDAFSSEIENNVDEIIKILNNPADITMRDTAIEQTVNRIVAEYYIESIALSDSVTLTVKDKDVLQKIDSLKESVLKNISLPKEIFRKNPSYSPWRLEKLKEEIMASQDLPSFLPLKPYIHGAYARFGKIVELVGRHLLGIHEKSHIFYTWLGHQWMFGTSLKQLIDSAIQKEEKDKGKKLNDREISSKVRETIENIDYMLRFQLVGAFKAYTDILELCLEKKGLSNLKEQIPPIHIYLEFGTADSAVISLIGTGLSRSTAIELIRTGIFAGLGEGNNAFEFLKSLKVENLEIPLVCKKELKRLIG